jgi:alkylated DNA nucleotide flippase Atl1
MRASETTFVGLIQGQKQFQVPLYQRTYSWQEKQLGLLWEDVRNQADLLADHGHGPTHFLGSVVLAPSTNTEAHFERWLVVDGQQRLTTLSLALAAVRDHLREDDPQAAERIGEQYLVNRWKEGDEHLRLLPTQADRPSYRECVRRGKAGGEDRLAIAYRFFRQQLAALDDPAGAACVEQVLTTRLTLVVITADQGDNVHRIFESLNNTGLRLSQADLLRNYLFMCLSTRAERVYEDYWLPLQRSLSNDQLEQLMWLQLVLDGDERVRRQDMYAAQQARMRREGETEDAAEAYIKELFRRCEHFVRIIDPVREPDSQVREYFQRLVQWRGSVAYPAVMVLLDRQERGELSTPDLLRALSYIESFLVRRAICQVPTNNLNRIFQALPAQLPTDRPAADGLRWVLSGARRFWPDDEDLREAIRCKPFYWQGRPEQRRMILQRLEESYEHPEPVNFGKAALTLEHVMPQTPGEEWLVMLAEGANSEESAEELHERLVHTLGNLTLTGENAKLSNHPFERKQDLLAGSHLEMNRRIADAARWGSAEILARADDLADRASALWPAPGAGGHRVERGRDWALLRQALMAMPAGTWTTYGDVAALIGSHPKPVGVHLANTPGLVNAHRVLGHDGRVSETFRWGTEDRGDVLDVLRDDGVTLDENNVADPAQRLSARDLADLVGMANSADQAAPDETDALDERQERFLDQIEEHNSPAAVAGVEELIECWAEFGGVFGFGDGATVTSCFLMLERQELPTIWPLTIYPTYGRAGYIEVVFKYLAAREPFDDLALREELRARLNKIPGVDIPASKLALRPSFPLGILEDSTSVRELCDILRWFCETAEPALL